MTYKIKITVYFDPCFLREHDYVLRNFGLASLICTRCGMTRYPRFECGGIDRERGIWGNAKRRHVSMTAP